MKRMITILCLLMLVAAMFGCTADNGEKTEGAAGQPGENADTTRMESATDTMMPDSMEHMMSSDSMMSDSM